MLPEKKGHNILYHIYFYNGGGVATGDVNNDGLCDIFFTANSKGNNKLYLNKGNFVFEDATEKAGVAGRADWCNGVTMADVNADGYLDIYVTTLSGKLGLQGKNELYINDGKGLFSEEAEKYGLAISAYGVQAAFFDYDRDGDLDCFLLNQSENPFSYIVDTSFRRKPDAMAGDIFLRNDVNTTGRFTDVSREAGIWQSKLGYGLGLAVGDMNNDGWDDIYVGNDFHENDYYYLNNQKGGFTDAGQDHFGHFSRFSMGNDIADYNNDGQLDIITVDMLPPDEAVLKTYGSDEQYDIYRQKITSNGFLPQYSRNCLQRNNGEGVSFSELGLRAGISATDWSWAPLFADFNNDGWKDLLITSGIPKRPADLDYVKFISDLYVKKQQDPSADLDDEALKEMPDGASHSFLFLADSSGRFADKSHESGTEKLKGYFNGAALADFDNDGDLDVVINAIDAPAVLWKNNLPVKNHLILDFSGDSLNRYGIGTKAYVFNAGKIQYCQLMLTRGFQSSSEPRLYFGLGEMEKIDSLLIVWPDQQYEWIKNQAVNSRLTVQKKNAGGAFSYHAVFPEKEEWLQDVSDKISLNWKHREDGFLDFNVQYLLPHKQSTRGPKLAVADVNGDGLEDFYVCGAAGQPGRLMVQTTKQKFLTGDTELFNQAASSEEVDALFFDANGDSFPDLYVVSGGNEKMDGDPSLADRLYLNNGKGKFIPAPAVPLPLVNKTCVASADIDHDGDPDLFIGGFADMRSYGMAQPSYLLLNDGKGNFQKAQSNLLSLMEKGAMVTDAAFADMNNDQWPDLVVAGEWMPVMVFLNNQGKFSSGEINGSSGLWQTIQLADVNGDGHPDILAGNWGENCKLWAGKNGPLKLYVKDFDGNGSVEQILCYTIDGNEYPFLAKDELERPLPTLKKGYLTYSEVAGKTVQYMLHNLFTGYTELKAGLLSSSCFINDGNGNFTRLNLPGELQLAPVFTFLPVGDKEQNAFLAAGNFYGVIPYEGRYDALMPVLFQFDKKQNDFIETGILSRQRGEFRDAAWIQTGGGEKLLVMARNNDRLLFFKPNLKKE